MESKAAIMADMNTPDFTFPQGQTWAVDGEKRTPQKSRYLAQAQWWASTAASETRIFCVLRDNYTCLMQRGGAYGIRRQLGGR